MFRSCTLKELLDVLHAAAALHGDAIRVTFVSDYGDHSHTQQVHNLRGVTEVKTIRPTAYSVSGWELYGRADANDPAVLVIS